jgi:hypothetical protein
MTDTDQKIPNFDDVAAMLRAEIVDCHAATSGVFGFARTGDLGYAVQMDAMKTATLLMKATAAASSALRRLYGSDTRHTVMVDRQGDTPSQNPKTNANAKPNAKPNGSVPA